MKIIFNYKTEYIDKSFFVNSRFFLGRSGREKYRLDPIDRIAGGARVTKELIFASRPANAGESLSNSPYLTPQSTRMPLVEPQARKRVSGLNASGRSPPLH